MPFKKVSNPSDQERKLEKTQQHHERKEQYQSFRQSPDFRARCSSTLRWASLTSGFAALTGMIVFAILGMVVNVVWYSVLIPCGMMLLGFTLAFFVANTPNQNQIRGAAYLIIFSGLTGIVVFQLMVGALNTVLIGYLWVVIMTILASLEVREIIAIALLTVVVSCSTILAEYVFKLYQPLVSIDSQPVLQMLVLIMMVGAILAELMMLVQTLYKALIDAEQRAKQSLEVSQRLSQTNQLGKQVSSSLNTIVAELNSTSRQQASGAQEQAAAVMEVTSSLSELGETARQIATNSNQVSISASEGLYSAKQVREATNRATKTAERGQAAVDSSIQAIEDVRNGITALAERLMTLTERSRQISSIIALIKEIADETHLLALNAAIESAGSGENGRRFSVVASEVKSLADRSLEATTEVAQVINELQGAVAAAVLASEETRKKTFGAVERSYQAGQVINELGQVVDETAESSDQIVDAVQQVSTLAEEIRLATQQQESAIRQIITTMESVGMVAQENASAVTQVSETVEQIDNLSISLKEALDSNSLTPAMA